MGGRRGWSCPLPWVRVSCVPHADLREEPVPSVPPCSVQVEEEAVYEEPPEQETVYEEPPGVGSLQQGRSVKGPHTQTCTPWLSHHGTPNFCDSLPDLSRLVLEEALSLMPSPQACGEPWSQAGLSLG